MCAAAQTSRNVTTEDTDESINYRPLGENWWSGGAFSKFGVDPTRLSGQSWMWAQSLQGDQTSATATFQFSGVSVYVFNVLIHFINVEFFLDDEPNPTTFVWQPSGLEHIQYNTVVYSRSGLDNTQHTLKMQLKNDGESMIFFD
ncbi:uncharacterized protein BXZ73DRAFT_56766, partial [Epithele typhae]